MASEILRSATNKGYSVTKLSTYQFAIFIKRSSLKSLRLLHFSLFSREILRIDVKLNFALASVIFDLGLNKIWQLGFTTPSEVWSWVLVYLATAI